MLADELGARVTRRRNSRFRPDRASSIINWGSTQAPDLPHVINSPGAVSTAVDKSACFDALSAAEGVRIPERLTKAEAEDRLRSGKRVVVRSLMRASGGRGMAVVHPGESIPEQVDGHAVQAYYRYIPKSWEFRVHCARDYGVFHLQQKRLRHGVDDRDIEIRNSDNGWVYCHHEVQAVPGEVLRQGWLGFQALGLDFGAVDVIYTRRKQRAWILEINTAPGLEGSTVQKYADVMRHLVSLKNG